jgi:hypothetical protein
MSKKRSRLGPYLNSANSSTSGTVSKVSTAGKFDSRRRRLLYSGECAAALGGSERWANAIVARTAGSTVVRVLLGGIEAGIMLLRSDLAVGWSSVSMWKVCLALGGHRGKRRARVGLRSHSKAQREGCSQNLPAGVRCAARHRRVRKSMYGYWNSIHSHTCYSSGSSLDAAIKSLHALALPAPASGRVSTGRLRLLQTHAHNCTTS